MTHGLTVSYGDETIIAEVQRRQRKTLEIAVLPDGSVQVKAPPAVSEDEIAAYVARRARWILRQRRYFAQFEPRTPPRRYVGGETHLYLGRQYRLAIDHGSPDGVRLVGGWLRVSVTDDASPEHVRRLLEGWYAQKARVRLAERLDACWLLFGHAGFPKPVLRLRRMRTRWASLSTRGTLSIRPDLIRAPRECIDYVLLHELCHLVHPNHGPEFRALLESVVPDWQKRKRRLELMLS